jgi:hypothetical protein
MAKFMESIFGKPTRDIVLQDVIDFFKVRQEETSTLEFKSGNVSLEDLYKSVSGLLNAEGGLLIVGSPTEQQEDKVDKKQKHVVKFAMGDLVPTTNFKTRESITQKLGTHIIPPPTGFDIVQFKLGDGYIYLIEVPQSLNPPHQVTGTGTGIYYIRNDNTTVPASHGIISALFNQRKQAILKPEIEISKHTRYGYLSEIEVSITNKSTYPADNAQFLVEVYNAKLVMGQTLVPKRVDRIFFKHGYSSGGQNVTLIKGLSIPFSFTVNHRYKQILICAVAYCVNSVVGATYVWYDGDNHSLVEIVETDDPKNEIAVRFIEYIRQDYYNRLNWPLGVENPQKDMFKEFYPKDEDEDKPIDLR